MSHVIQTNKTSFTYRNNPCLVVLRVSEVCLGQELTRDHRMNEAHLTHMNYFMSHIQMSNVSHVNE